MINNAKKKARKQKVTLEIFTKTLFELRTTNLSSVKSVPSSSFLCTIVRISRVKVLSHYNYQSLTTFTYRQSPRTPLSSLLASSQSITYRSNESSPSSSFIWGSPKQEENEKLLNEIQLIYILKANTKPSN
ncbi:unnamed protein product [Didymodactylos carnosus]|uniref:Uncharacterized protein n=1 Tax=Didymodactylos carnosus TaxID=1234261 RepID=A0A815R2A6_9BILA|nr:unnamed protein product [Didymodactylos carnosus]CAF1472844.1 unnamed protein product [Didymodactylos carnosus]CAF4264378.1 unnamed protein product [Didymodactylos carnosus]CAF4338164.1 unnamed protein product [Didymodactylos carnosus]